MANLIEEKDFIEMESVLKKISKKLSLGDDKKDYIDGYTEVRTEFLTALRKEDPIFNSYKKIQMMGSSYERTRIRLADEFDMNICMKLPFDYSHVVLKNGPTGGFVTIKIPGQLEILKKSPQWVNFKSIDKWMDNEGNIFQDKLRLWMHSVCTKASNSLNSSSSEIWSKYKVTIKPSGPSIGLWVEHRLKGIKFSVDFVPVLVFKYPIWPSNVNKKYATEFSTDEWYAVPKQVSGSPEVTGKLWRISFPQQECDMLKGKNQLRVAQRLIKQLRENRECTFLKSYFIKTVFMLMVEKKKDDRQFWQKSVSYIFMFMLTDLYEKICNGTIPFFWDHSYNILSALTPNQLSHCKNSLQGSIKFIGKHYKDERKILELLMPPSERGTLQSDGISDFEFVDQLVADVDLAIQKKENQSWCVIS